MLKVDILNSADVAAQTKPGQDGKRKRLVAKLAQFKDSNAVEGIQFSYSFAQGKGLYYTASYADCHHILTMLQNALRSKEPVVESLPHSSKNKPDVILECGRNQDLEPFIRIRGAGRDGQPLSKDFYFTLSRGKSAILRNGQPIPDLELQERCAAIFIKTFNVYIRALEENYEKAPYNPGGGYGNQGGYNNGGGYNNNGGGYNNNNGGGYNNRNGGAPAATANYDDILD